MAAGSTSPRAYRPMIILTDSLSQSLCLFWAEVTATFLIRFEQPSQMSTTIEPLAIRYFRVPPFHFEPIVNHPLPSIFESCPSSRATKRAVTRGRDTVHNWEAKQTKGGPIDKIMNHELAFRRTRKYLNT
ncbi:hypothetical protein GGR54DRAFT_636852 [Hypoxylon sp. NC1633]|nr:hypothetical protein GGR54DRAFT_636852 [Hypoxylon sp. NC1633]